MDVTMLAMLVSILKNLPDTAVSESLENAERAEAAAENAIEHGYGLSVSGTKLVFTVPGV